MIRAILLSLGLLALPGVALALSCARPDMARSFQFADDAEGTYHLLLGEIEYTESKLLAPTEPETLKARLRARGITRTGFSAWIDRDVTVNITCAGPWCGSVPENERLLIFLRQDGADWVIDAPPCGGFVFVDPGQAEMRILRSCLSGGSCKPRYR
ncbi:hypothetical protein RXV86_19385 [Alisedimentitalea sp. MJ-SS2]|uniref:hypothetical protein n=1 Tax=Aliisedimentitalea sp. MJ-SS2 TaxID=3049795 RepID=UPI00290C12C5|nr:hypothetical protein [Alisedimentitalea sp. MJ-SS2]MDU8929559.1 hypothetical protein [Alisedimentitalea sp. MJ-SS2]